MVDKATRERALELALGGINKTFGKGSAYRYGDAKPDPIPRIPSGSIKLDDALGGGYAVGKIIEIFGPESSGKTTLALHAVTEVQQRGGIAAFIDAEHALDLGYAEALGINVGELVISQPSTAEQALGVVDHLVRGACDVVVVDSVAALVPRAELEGDIGDSHMGLQARLMGQTLRKITGAAAAADCTVIFLNQIRHKIGVFFGNPETTPGGLALKFYASQRLDIRRTGKVERDKEIIANKTRVKVIKNKTAPPFKLAEFEIVFGIGIDKVGELVDLAVETGAMEKKGSWYTVEVGDEESISLQGKPAVADAFAVPAVYEKYKERVCERLAA